MKNIDNYILERLNPRHLGTEKFPIGGTIDEIVKFLERQGFEEIENKSYLLIQKSNKFNGTNSKSYMLAIDLRICFADTSKNNISEENPIFYYDESHKEYGIHGREYTGMIATNENIFKDELKKRFGWK